MPPVNVAETLKALNENVQGFKTSLDEFKADIEVKFDGTEKRVTEMEKAMERRIIKETGPKEIPTKKWSWARFAYGCATKDWRHSTFEKEECDKHMESVEKIMQASSFSGGGSLVPPQYVAELIEFLRPRLIVSALGVRMMTGLTSSPVIIPKLTAGVTSYWIAPEGTSITATDQKTGKMELQPHKVAALTKLSNDLVLLANPSIEASVRSDLTTTLAEAIDTAFFQGIGTSGQPLGLVNQTPAIPTEGGYSGDADAKVNAFKKALLTLENNFGLVNASKYAMNPTSYWAIQQLVDANKRHYLQMDPGVADRTTLLGYGVERSTLVSPAATDDVYIGNWDDTIMAMWSQVEVSGSTETSTAFTDDELWVRAIARVDCGLRREKSFVRITGVS